MELVYFPGQPNRMIAQMSDALTEEFNLSMITLKGFILIFLHLQNSGPQHKQ